MKKGITSNPKKALFVATNNTFILNFLVPYLKLFKERGYEVHVATGDNGKIPFCDKKHFFHVIRKPLTINNLRAIKELKKIIADNHFDIIHCHTPMGGAVTRLAAKKIRENGTRVIYTAHGFHFFKGAPLHYWFFFYPIEKWLARYTDTIITINQEDYSIAKRKFKKCNDIQYVPGVGIDSTKYDKIYPIKEKNNLKQRLGLKKTDFIITYVARIDNNKNQFSLIKDISELLQKDKAIHLIFIGKDELSGKCQALVQKLKLDTNIHFLGDCNNVPELLSISNLAISSSFREGLPIGIIESMCANLPVLAMPCRGTNELLSDLNGGKIIERNNPLDLSKTICYYKEHPKICHDAGAYNHEKSLQYDLSNIRQIYEQIYFKKKKVLHLLSSNRFSGAENVACTIINNLGDEYDACYCSPSGPICEALTKMNIRHIPIKTLSVKELKYILKESNPEIIHAHDVKASLLAAFCAPSNITIISHIHNDDPRMHKPTPRSLLFLLIRNRLSRIIWVSQNAFDNYCFASSIQTKSVIIPNVIDCNRILSLSKEYTSKPYDIIFLGRLEPQKDPLRFIEIIKKLRAELPNIKVAMVGDGFLRQEIENRISKYNLQKNITLFGFQNNPYPILVNSKMLCSTSKYEGLPMSFLEAAALGKPIISFSECSLDAKMLDGIILAKDESDFIIKTKGMLSKKQLPTHIARNNILNYITKIKKQYSSSHYV